MANNIVKYSNELNTVAFTDFGSTEMNIFFSIIAKVKEKKNETVRMSFDELANLSNLDGSAYDRHWERFVDMVETTYDRLTNLKMKFQDENELRVLVLFDEFLIRSNERYVEVSVSPKAVPLLNNLTGNWTRFNLLQFSNLKSIYAKSMFRLIKQYRTTGYFRITPEKLRYLLDVPATYTNGDITRRVIGPVKVELAPIFQNFTVKILKKKRFIVGYEFSWKPEAQRQDDFDKAVWNREKMLKNIETNSSLTDKEKDKARRMVAKIDFKTVGGNFDTTVSAMTELNSSPTERRVLRSDMVKESDKPVKTDKGDSRKKELSHIHIPLYRWSDKPDTFNN